MLSFIVFYELNLSLFYLKFDFLAENDSLDGSVECLPAKNLVKKSRQFVFDEIFAETLQKASERFEEKKVNI